MEKGKNKTNNREQCCGLVMPISAIDNCNEKHWVDVMGIITESIEAAGFIAQLVSAADEVGIIQKRIIQNLYENPIIVCDVSGKNPNVMFELGMRLTFDKPTIIVKDDQTSYSFDTSPIEHLEYPRDLRFTKIVDFKKALSKKILATYEQSIADHNYSTFLKHFGTFTVSKLDSKELSKEDYIIAKIDELKHTIMRQHSVQSLQRRIDSFHIKYNAFQQEKETPNTDSYTHSAKDNTIIYSDEIFHLHKKINAFLSDLLKKKTIMQLMKTDYRENIFIKISSGKQFKKLQTNAQLFRKIFDDIYQESIQTIANEQTKESPE